MARTKQEQVTYKRLSELLSYNAETGIFTWIVKGRAKRPSNIAGSVTIGGYIQIQIDGVLHKAHRLAWLFMTGEHAKLEIDHINGNPADNSFLNLREVDSSTNKENKKIARADNSSGMLGAHFHKKFGWRSSIKIKGKTVHIGYFNNAQDAHNAYLSKKREVHYGCTI